MNTEIRHFNEKFLKNVHRFEDLLRTLKFNQIRLNNRRAAGIEEEISVKDLISPAMIYAHNREWEEVKENNLRILAEYQFESYEHHLRYYGDNDSIILKCYQDCKRTKRFLGRVNYYIGLLRKIEKIIAKAEA
jgi:hypothetical protein|nr:MAG TPA: hypothetical protein [Bacteriophage sp.]